MTGVDERQPAKPGTFGIRLAGRGLAIFARIFSSRTNTIRPTFDAGKPEHFIIELRSLFLLTVAAGDSIALYFPQDAKYDRLAGFFTSAGAAVIRGPSALAGTQDPVAIPVVLPGSPSEHRFPGLAVTAICTATETGGDRVTPLALTCKSAWALDPGIDVEILVPWGPVIAATGVSLPRSASSEGFAMALAGAGDTVTASKGLPPKTPPRTLTLYRNAMRALALVAEPYLAWRARKGKEDPDRKDERFGRAGVLREPGRVGWVHAASVGESVSILPLIRRLLDAKDLTQIVVTTGTVTSADIMAARLPVGAVHQYVPLDSPAFVDRFIDHWRPDFAMFVESEIWPNIFAALKDRSIPIAIVNGRMSAPSFLRWQKRPGFISSVLASADLCIAQNEVYAKRYARLGAPYVVTLGNIKFDAPPLPVPRGELERLTELTSMRPLWLAASTHPGEEEAIAEVHLSMRDKHPDLLTIVVPRHPERGEDVATLLEDRWLATARRSTGADPRAAIDVYVADTIGELGLFYQLCNCAFIGGSLTGIGGHNPVEAALLGCAVLHGPHVHNFRDMFETFDTAGAAVEVANAGELFTQLDRLMGSPDAINTMTDAARDVLNRNAGALNRTVDALGALSGPRRRGHD